MTPSASTAPTYGVQDWVRILHNAASTPQDHPRYGEARQVAQLALQNIDQLQGQASAADPEAQPPGQIGTALVSFGHGASLGLAGDPDYLAQARAANPWTAGIADVAGTAALGGLAAPVVAGLSPVAGAAVLGGGLAASRGAIEPIPGMTRGESALVMGAGGAISSGAAAKVVSKLLPIAVTVGKNAYKIFGTVGRTISGGPAEGVPAAVHDVAEAAVRAELKRLNVHPAVIERTVQAWKTGKVPEGAIDLPPPEPAVSRVGETITPMEPQLPALRQADWMATQPAYVRGGNPRGLPLPPGPAATPPGMPLGVPGTLQALEQQLGRPLTPPETQSVLERLLGPAGGLPASYGRPP